MILRAGDRGNKAPPVTLFLSRLLFLAAVIIVMIVVCTWQAGW